MAKTKLSLQNTTRDGMNLAAWCRERLQNIEEQETLAREMIEKTHMMIDRAAEMRDSVRVFFH